MGAKTIRHADQTLQGAIMYRKLKEFHLVEGIQQTKFYTVMSIDASTGNDPMKQQGLANTTCCKHGQRCHYRKD